MPYTRMQKVRAVESRFLEANDIVSLESDGPLEYLRGIVLLRERERERESERERERERESERERERERDG